VESKSEAATLMLSEWSAQLTTRSGLELNVRPASPQDEQAVSDFFGKVSPDDLRFRFLSSLKSVGAGLVHKLVDVDHTATENLLAFEAKDGGLAATAMIAADEQSSDAEVAISVRSDLKGRGVGWAMLQHACDYARARGFKQLHTVELSDNRLAISLEQEMGFTGRPCPDDMNLTILTKQLEPA
jgi:GNAT superfamily N-acetyltransferase